MSLGGSDAKRPIVMSRTCRSKPAKASFHKNEPFCAFGRREYPRNRVIAALAGRVLIQWPVIWLGESSFRRGRSQSSSDRPMAFIATRPDVDASLRAAKVATSANNWSNRPSHLPVQPQAIDVGRVSRGSACARTSRASSSSSSRLTRRPPLANMRSTSLERARWRNEGRGRP